MNELELNKFEAGISECFGQCARGESDCLLRDLLIRIKGAGFCPKKMYHINRVLAEMLLRLSLVGNQRQSTGHWFSCQMPVNSLVTIGGLD